MGHNYCSYCYISMRQSVLGKVMSNPIYERTKAQLIEENNSLLRESKALKERLNECVGGTKRDLSMKLQQQRDKTSRFVQQLDALKEQNALLTRQVWEAQAEIDRLMLEYCPAEMSEEQITKFAEAQEPLGEEFQKVLNDNRWELYEGETQQVNNDARDAERYRYIRMPHVGFWNIFKWEPKAGCYRECNGQLLDAAIDDALSEVHKEKSCVE